MSASRLERALLAHAGQAGLAVTVMETRIRPWFSATFEGERVRMVVTGDAGPLFDGWLSALPEADLPLPGCYVADLCVLSATGGAAELEALVLRDA